MERAHTPTTRRTPRAGFLSGALRSIAHLFGSTPADRAELEHEAQRLAPVGKRSRQARPGAPGRRGLKPGRGRRRIFGAP